MATLICWETLVKDNLSCSSHSVCVHKYLLSIIHKVKCIKYKPPQVHVVMAEQNLILILFFKHLCHQITFNNVNWTVLCTCMIMTAFERQDSVVLPVVRVSFNPALNTISYRSLNPLKQTVNIFWGKMPADGRKQQTNISSHLILCFMIWK